METIIGKTIFNSWLQYLKPTNPLSEVIAISNGWLDSIAENVMKCMKLMLKIVNTYSTKLTRAFDYGP